MELFLISFLNILLAVIAFIMIYGFSWHYYKKLFLNYRNNIVFKMCLL